MRIIRVFELLGVLALLSWSGLAIGQVGGQVGDQVSGEANQPAVPPLLQDWQQWVLHDAEHRQCPYFLGRSPGPKEHHQCAWPGWLNIDLAKGGASFTLEYRALSESWITLPGNTNNWPDQVSANGNALTVISSGQSPITKLAAGNHRITGQFIWDKPPESLRLPTNVALLKVSRDGKALTNPQRRGNELWLGQRQTTDDGAPAADATSITVMRKIRDGIPLQLSTHLQVDVSGRAREEILGRALPEGFAITAVQSDFPLRIDDDGNLIAQLRAGGGQVVIEARALRLPETIAVPTVASSAVASSWPAEEIWSFELASQYRVAQLEGGLPVDGRQVETAWPDLPNYLVRGGTELVIVERSRGLASDEPNRLSLQRRWWLDFDAQGFSVEDQIRGRMIRDWRLDLREPLVMQSAANNKQPLMITRGAEADLSGVQAFDHTVNLQTTARLEGRPGKLPIAGYAQRMERVDAILSLPPGYRLLAADADSAPQAWIERWNVLDLFLVLVIAAAAWRLLGPLWGISSGAYLLLGFQESGLPVWSVLVLVITIGLLSLTPAGALQSILRSLRNLAMLTVLLITLPFVVNQFRTAMHPQLESQQYAYAFDSGFGAQKSVAYEAEAPQPADQAAPKVAPRRDGSAQNDYSLEEVIVTSARKKIVDRYQSNALVQAGYGRPRWDWNQYQLSWNGPVEADQQTRLLIAPAWLISSLRIILACLLLAVLGRLLMACLSEQLRRTLRQQMGDKKWAGVLLGTIVLITTVPSTAFAQPSEASAAPDQTIAGQATLDGAPTPALLDTLRQRLQQPAKCAPNCASVDGVSVNATGNRLTLTLQVHSADRLALPLPVSSSSWQWTNVTLNGEAGQAISKNQNQRWLAIEPGIHQVVIDGRLNADQVAIQFAAAPKLVRTVRLEGWQINGVVNRRINGGITLSRIAEKLAADNPEQRGKPIRAANFVRLHRALIFDNQWLTQTQLERIAPSQGTISVPVALLPGEAVQTSAIEIVDRVAMANFGAEQRSLNWQAQLEASETVSLTAADRNDVVEVWSIFQSPLWQLQIDGIPRNPPDANFRGAWELEYYPRRGETLTIKVRRPEAIAGATVAIDHIALRHQIGDRSSNGWLELSLRASRAEQHPITLPEQIEITSVSINGRAINLRPTENQLVIPVDGGESKVQIGWREPQAAGFHSQTATPNVGAAAANIYLDLELPADRWVLWTTGPRRGPAILYWAELLVMILVAWALSKTATTPLKFRHWLLLGLGFSTFSWPLLALVVSWLFALAWRRNRTGPIESRWGFNLLQIGLVGLTIIALGALVFAIPTGLLGQPDMHIRGGVNGQLGWFHDRSAGLLPVAQVWSIPLWWYKALMLAWALWLALALTRWLPWAWQSLIAGQAWQGKLNLTTDSDLQPPEDTGTP